MNSKWILLALSLIGPTALLVVTTGCSETQISPTPEPVAQIVQEKTPTLAPTPTPTKDHPISTTTATPTSRSVEPPIRQPTPTATPSSTPVPTVEAASPKAKVVVEAGNVRSGPGLAYPVIGQIGQGDTLTVLKRDQPGNWLQIAWEDEPAWLSASLVTLNVGTAALDVAEVIAPPPAAPTSTPALILVQVPHCDSVPIRGFGTVWGEHTEVATTLGCPSWPYREQGTDAAVQIFERGLMLWLAADSSYGSDPVYALFDTGEYQRFPDMGPADPAAVGSVPESFHPPGDRFSKAYWEGTGARVRQRLGYAISPQMNSPGAYQQFWNGRMFWTGAVDRIFVLYDYWQWDETGENQVQIRSWIGFEDTFGD